MNSIAENHILNAKKILYGGDYNPEQWPREIWEEDMKLFKGAGVDTVTLNTFGWAALQPSEEEYSFDKLDEIMDMAERNGLSVCLATSTAAHPAWMAARYPDILRVEFNGMKRKFGGRHNSCPNSPTYRKYSVRLARKLAERYGSRKHLIAWHVSNEYGGECYCENCEKAFRVWLRKKYGTIDQLNAAWNTAFWGHTFYSWEEIVLPNLLSEHFEYDRSQFQSITLDYKRFNSESILECYLLEYQAIKEITPQIPVTTNLMGFYKTLDYQKWAPHMDVISWDNYPANEDTPARIAMNHDLMRSLKGGQSFLLMEQTPSVTNWLPYNALKRPGVMRLWSYQAVAHGADSVLFFQMRRSITACEKLHGALIDHVGTGNTRVYREAAALGAELSRLGAQTLGARTRAKAAIYVDWDNWWAVECSAGPSCELRYLDEVYRYYEALHSLNVPVDFVGEKDDLSGYALVIAPVLYMTKPGYDQVLREYVQSGGCLVSTFFSGIADENDRIITGGYPGKLRDILGIWVEESDALPAGTKNSFCLETDFRKNRAEKSGENGKENCGKECGGKTYDALLLCDLLHCEGARVLGRFQEDFYAGFPAVTEYAFGKGYAYYVACRSEAAFYRDFLEVLCRHFGAESLLPPVPGLEVCLRENENGSFLFLLNHGTETVRTQAANGRGGEELLTGRVVKDGEILEIGSKDVMIIRQAIPAPDRP